MSNYLRWAEVPPRKDVYTYAGTTRWGNHDLYPIPKKERTYGWLGYFAYWVTCGVSVSNFTIGSAYIAYGLNAGETIGAVLLGACVAACNAYFCARPGQDHFMGYTMMARAAFGMWGALVPYIVVLLGGIVFSGIQAYFGGQAITIILGAVFPSFHHLENTLPTSAAITTQNLISFVIYFILYVPIIIFVPPHQIRRFLYPSFIIITCTFFGILGWAVHTNNGVGPLVASGITISASSKAFRIIQCASSVGGSWSGAAERISDWSRFSKNKTAAAPGMIFALPITVTLTALIGVLVASATQEIYGELIWDPLTLLAYIQTTSYTPACRAGTFFAGTGILSSQIFINLTQNTVPWGMDMTGCFPRYLTMKRGGLLLCALTMLAQPWRFLTQAYVFVEILSALSLFVGASTIILVADYWIIRKKMWKVPDLYKGGNESIYWFYHGWNWRCVLAVALGMFPGMPGLVYTITGQYGDTNPWVRIFQINYFVGAPIGFVVFVSLSLIWPPRGLGIQENLEEHMPVIEGVSDIRSESVAEKGASEGTKTVDTRESEV